MQFQVHATPPPHIEVLGVHGVSIKMPETVSDGSLELPIQVNRPSFVKTITKPLLNLSSVIPISLFVQCSMCSLLVYSELLVIIDYRFDIPGPLWSAGFNYQHLSGSGIGSFLSVEECKYHRDKTSRLTSIQFNRKNFNVAFNHPRSHKISFFINSLKIPNELNQRFRFYLF